MVTTMSSIRVVAVFLLTLHSLAPVAAATDRAPLPSTIAGAANAASSGLKGLLGYFKSEPDLLPSEEAFALSMRVLDPATLVAEFTPTPGYFLYRDRIHFKVLEPADIVIKEVLLPEGQIKADPTFGNVAIFHQPFRATIALQRPVGPAALHLTVSYQGCSDQGVCYPPVDRQVLLTLPAMTSGIGTGSPAASPVAAEMNIASDRTTATWSRETASSALPVWLDANRSIAMLHQQHIAWILLGFFGFGLLLSLTPCVWPMIPILSGVIAGQGPSVGRSRAFWLSLAYVLGMAATYSMMGIAAGLSGTLLSTAMQTPWAIAAMALLYVALALSMFGLYELQMPAFMQNRLLGTGQQTGARTSIGVFTTGAVSAIIVGPCVAAPLAGALLYIGQTQNVILGGSALFALALGKGVPLVVVGTSLGSVLPRSGPWLKQVKAFLGVLLLGTAIWVALPLVGTPLGMAAAGVLLVCYAVYLRAFDALPAETMGFRRLTKGLGMTGFLIGAIYLVGAASGSTDFSRPLAGLTAGVQGSTHAPLPFQRVASLADLEARLRDSGGRYVMLDFYADWCITCKEMEQTTFSDPAVRDRLKNVMLLQADVTSNSSLDKQLLSRFQLFGPPAILFFDPSGREVAGTRTIGFVDAPRFASLLDQVLR